MPVFNRFFLDKNTISPRPLAQAGAVLQVEISIPTALAKYLSQRNAPLPPPVAGLALIDTGASRTCVDGERIVGLGVNPIGTASTGTAAGPVRQYLYPAKLSFPTEGMEFEFSSVIGVDLSGQTVAGQDVVVLIGRDVLARCVLVYNGPGGFFTLAL